MAPHAGDAAPNQRSGRQMFGAGIFNPNATPPDHTTEGIMLALRLPTKDIELWLDRVRGWLHDLGGANDVTGSQGPGACHVDHEHDRPRTRRCTEWLATRAHAAPNRRPTQTACGRS